jgi:large subunit ribosomal protein L1
MLVKERAKAKFDETIRIGDDLGVDPRHGRPDGAAWVNLPNGRAAPCASVCSHAAPRRRKSESKPCQIVVRREDPGRERSNSGNIDFDRCIATPDMMPLVGPPR